MSSLPRRVAHLLCLLLIVAVPGSAGAQKPVVAAASDLSFALTEISERFTKETGQQVELVFGSSGTLTRQIRDGAPFDLFLSADESFVEQLASAGLTRDGGALYAIGRIALFAPTGSPMRPDEGLAGLGRLLAAGKVTRFAIANPQHAPYGRAAEAALRKAGLWADLQPQLVLGDNVSQAAQFATTGDAVGGIIAHSHRPRSDLGGSRHLRVDPGHRPSALAPAHGGAQASGTGRGPLLRVPPGCVGTRDPAALRLRASAVGAMDWSAARVSVALGLTTVGLLLPAGIWAGHALARRHFRGKAIVEAAVAIPLILPPTVLGFYLLHAFSTGSALGAAFQQVMGHALAFSFPGLVLASAVANIPFVVQPIQRAFESVPADVREAAACCGLTPMAALRANRGAPGVARDPHGGDPRLRAHAG